jgi:RimJ/RimL family protein N-acetyltransferase
MHTSSTDQILLEFPESFETERLFIRAPLWGDGTLVNEAIRESIHELRPWMPWVQQIPDIDETEMNIRRARLQFLERTNMRLHLVLKDTGEFIGSSGLHRIDWQVRKFEIGYWVRTPFCGQGYISEAVQGITDFAIHTLGANRLEIRCDARNKRSARVAERLDFTLEGILRNDSCDVDCALCSTKVFAKVRGMEF